MKTNNKQKKQEIVSEIESKIEQSNSIIVWKYHNVDSNKMANFRINVKNNQDSNKIYKNRLAKIAFTNKNMAQINELLLGPNAFLFLNTESVESLKFLNKMSKENELIEFVGGFIEGKFYDGNKIKEIAGLPSKSDLLSMLLSVLQAPMRNLAYSISQINPSDNK